MCEYKYYHDACEVVMIVCEGYQVHATAIVIYENAIKMNAKVI